MPSRRDAAASPAALDDATIARLRALLLRDFRRRTRDAELAEDLAQESLVHVLRGLAGRKSDAAVDAWARRIALNVWRDHLRRAVARPGERADSASSAAILDVSATAAHVATVEEEHDRKTTHQCLLEATRRLPVAGRRVLLLCDFGDMPLVDAANALGCSLAAAKVRLHRARRRLGEICREQCRCEAGGGGAPACTPKRAPP